MGLLVAGKWQNEWYDTKNSQVEFIREESCFRNWIVPKSKIKINSNTFPAERHRYHLYISCACPCAHRVLIFLNLKRLFNIISFSLVEPLLLNQGWEFGSETSTQDPIYDFQYLHQIYTTAKPDYTGRVTVPVLWDKFLETIVNNESSEIIRMLNNAFDDFTNISTDYYPKALRREINEINDYIYDNIINGVYLCGFATKQEIYEKAYDNIFSALDSLETRLQNQRYLVGNQITEADWLFFPTLIRFDLVYYSHFKINKQRIKDYPNLYNYLKDLFQEPGIADTVDWQQIKSHYYYSHTKINPTQIIPKGPDQDLFKAHNRHRFN